MKKISQKAKRILIISMCVLLCTSIGFGIYRKGGKAISNIECYDVEDFMKYKSVYQNLATELLDLCQEDFQHYEGLKFITTYGISDNTWRFNYWFDKDNCPDEYLQEGRIYEDKYIIVEIEKESKEGSKTWWGLVYESMVTSSTPRGLRGITVKPGLVYFNHEDFPYTIVYTQNGLPPSNPNNNLYIEQLWFNWYHTFPRKGMY